MLRMGVSSCLLGEAVRWDGRHKYCGFLAEALGPHCEWVPVCPEMEIGLGVPREPVRLETPPQGGGPRLVATASRADHTERLAGWARGRLEALGARGLDGWVLKARSPSCGLEVAVHDSAGRPVETGRGAFAKALTEAFPRLPAVTEDALETPGGRLVFLLRASAWRRLRRRGADRGRGLASFHAGHRPLLAELAGEGHPVLTRLDNLSRGDDGPAYAAGVLEAVAAPAARPVVERALEELLEEDAALLPRLRV